MLIKASRYVAKLRRTKTFIFNLAIFSWPELLSPWKLIFSIKIGWFFSLHKFSDFSPTFIWLSTPARLDWQFVKKNIVRFIFLDVTKKLVCTTFSLVSYAQQGRSWPRMENCVNSIFLRLTPARVCRRIWYEEGWQIYSYYALAASTVHCQQQQQICYSCSIPVPKPL